MEYIEAKTILSPQEKRGWFGSLYNMNIYRGCSHGCIYCDSRSDCYGIENFDTVKPKKDALQILERELRSKVTKGVVGMGAMSDPYNPLEEKLSLTKGSLELLQKYHFGLTLATKSDLILRDIDLLKAIKKHAPLLIKMTITTIDDELTSKIEPYAPSSQKRMEAIKVLSAHHIKVGILLMPVLPFITDEEDALIELIYQAKAAGAFFIYPHFGVTLRDSQRMYFYEKLKLLDKTLVASYIKNFGNEYNCLSPHHKRLWKVFKEISEKEKILYRQKDIINAYQGPYKIEEQQLF